MGPVSEESAPSPDSTTPDAIEEISADEMITEAARLKSFKNWPFSADAACSAHRMAEAGFYHCPTDQEKDAVQCFVCFKELDGWESTDIPWTEHLKHSKDCPFAKAGKPQNQLTIREIFEIEAERKCNKVKRLIAARILYTRAKAEEIEEFAFDIHKVVSKSKS